MLIFPLLACLYGTALCCSRVTYSTGNDGRYVIGRSMDFVEDTHTTIYALPAGMDRNGSVNDNPLNWTSKYGSLSLLMYGRVAVEGFNTEGLTASTLYLDRSDYGERNPSRPGLLVTVWMQYFLDMYASVDEAAADVCTDQERFQVVTSKILSGVESVGHVIVSDRSGDNLIMEYRGGKLSCYHSHNYSVMTNEPWFDEQLAISTYWSQVSNYSLPGTSRPADRFARLAHYNSIIPGTSDPVTAYSYTGGMIRAVSVPMVPKSVILESGSLDVWPTLWRTYEDPVDLIFIYDSNVDGMNFYVNATLFDLSVKGSVLKLPVSGVPWTDLVGDVTDKFVAV